ncbi:MAG: lipid-A-disaccharide synthase [bacterium]|nr:lipid-A-disaccharide synthase [bacterium]MDW8164790.1 lipid-A-disaccharide synthase [Candidatus Omnitrophota bacterium]
MKICILAGEKSGDNYGALLSKNLKKLVRNIFIFGTGGECMRKEGVKLIEGLPFGEMGFSGVVKKIFTYISFLKKVVTEIEKEKPDIVVFIDNPGFNLEVAKRLKKRFKTCYYIPPKIWAHNYKRIKIIKKYIDFVIPIFPFEIDIYKKENVSCVYFGHPFVDLINKEDGEIEKKGDENIIGILPGSRKEELIYNLPVMKKIIEGLRKKVNFKVLISAINEEFKKIIENIFKNTTIQYEIRDDLHTILKISDVIIAVSGTVNLEVAYFEKPMIVIYRTSFLNYLLCRLIVRIKMISPVNIVIGEKIVPEYIQKFKIESIINDIFTLIKKEENYIIQIEGIKKVKEILCEKNVSEKIASFIIEGVKSL